MDLGELRRRQGDHCEINEGDQAAGANGRIVGGDAIGIEQPADHQHIGVLEHLAKHPVAITDAMAGHRFGDDELASLALPTLFLAAANDEFWASAGERLVGGLRHELFPARQNGRVLFPFRRLFVIASR